MQIEKIPLVQMFSTFVLSANSKELALIDSNVETEIAEPTTNG